LIVVNASVQNPRCSSCATGCSCDCVINVQIFYTSFYVKHFTNYVH